MMHDYRATITMLAQSLLPLSKLGRQPAISDGQLVDEEIFSERLGSQLDQG